MSARTRSQMIFRRIFRRPDRLIPRKFSLLVVCHLRRHCHQIHFRAVAEHGKIQGLPDRFGKEEFLQAFGVGNIHLADLQEDVAGPQAGAFGG